MSIRSLTWLSTVIGRLERIWSRDLTSQVRVSVVSAVRTRAADHIELLHSPSELGTSNAIPVNFSAASFLIECC